MEEKISLLLHDNLENFLSNEHHVSTEVVSLILGTCLHKTLIFLSHHAECYVSNSREKFKQIIVQFSPQCDTKELRLIIPSFLTSTNVKETDPVVEKNFLSYHFTMK